MIKTHNMKAAKTRNIKDNKRYVLEGKQTPKFTEHWCRGFSDFQR